METSIPVIRLEVEYMKHAILHAFTAHQLKIDTDLKEALERFCQPANIKAIVGKAVDQTLKNAIESEIENFFLYGAGRATIAEAVKKRLEKMGEYA